MDSDGGTSALTLGEQVERLRECSVRLAALQAEQLRLVAELAADCGAAALAELARGPRVPGQPEDAEVASSAAAGELMAALGITEGSARWLTELGTRLVTVHPEVLAALSTGQLDLTRAKALVEATRVLDDGTARRVGVRLLEGAGEWPWTGPSPRAWRSRIDRAVTVADRDAARRRREAAVAARAVRSWPNGDGTGELNIRAADHDIVMASSVIDDLARAWRSTDDDGNPLSMDQRRVDALMDVFRRIRQGAALPHVGVHRERDVGVVVHGDTLFGRGAAADAPGELRGLGRPATLDPVSAREVAEAALATGAAVRALVTDAAGVVQRVLRLTSVPAGGWTRESLMAACREALQRSPQLRTKSYAPTQAIADHVRTVHPRCVSYDCARVSRRCDLDHDTPWPRGPTDVFGLAPRCRRHHEHKTRGLVRTRLFLDGSTETVYLSGVVLRSRPEPLPGFGPGEGYDPIGTWLPGEPAA